MSILKLNFTNYKAAQDMIKLIEKEKGLSTSEAIDFSINLKICNRILKTGWGSIALPIWSHDDPERKWLSLNDPRVEVEINDEKAQLISKVATEESVNMETAVAYFLLFTMEMLGYHI